VIIENGLSYLANLQKEDGIWPHGPMRRMPGDAVASLFILYQLGESCRFRAAIRFNDALGWFSRNRAMLSRECQGLCEWASLRWRTSGIRNAEESLFAA